MKPSQFSAAIHAAVFMGFVALAGNAILNGNPKIARKVESISAIYLNDPSYASSYRAVNVLDLHLDEATRMHFISRAQGSFWTAYQKIKGQRAAVEQFLKELD